MKKIIIILSMFLLIGCSNSLDKKLVKNIKVLETNNINLSRLKINYKTYKENTKGILKDYSNKDGEIIFSKDDKRYSAIDLNDTSKEELKNYREYFINHFKDKKINAYTNNVLVKISKPYEADYNNWKYIFVKIIKKYNTDDNIINITNKRYTIEKFNDKWKVILIDKDIGFFYDNMENKKGITKKEGKKLMKYQTVNNNDVEYILSFNPLK